MKMLDKVLHCGHHYDDCHIKIKIMRIYVLLTKTSNCAERSVWGPGLPANVPNHIHEGERVDDICQHNCHIVREYPRAYAIFEQICCGIHHICGRLQ